MFALDKLICPLACLRLCIRHIVASKPVRPIHTDKFPYFSYHAQQIGH